MCYYVFSVVVRQTNLLEETVEINMNYIAGVAIEENVLTMPIP
jgi:hypothetical protein